jgi:hypothetical protein
MSSNDEVGKYLPKWVVALEKILKEIENLESGGEQARPADQHHM